MQRRVSIIGMKTINRLHASASDYLDRARGWRPYLTRTRVALFALTLVVVGISLGGIDSAPQSEAMAYSRSLELQLPSREAPEAPELAGQATLMPLPDSFEAAPPGDELWREVSVRPGQTLDSIFRQQGYSIALLQQIVNLNGDTRRLAKIRPGDVFGFQNSADGSLARMRYALDESAYLIIENTPDGPRPERLARQVYTTTAEAEGRIESSLFLAGKQAGLSDNMIMKLANVFGWDIDFVLDIRAGDRFFLVYEKVYRDGEFLRDGEILAATFVNQGIRFQAIRFEVEGVAHYFAPDGGPMRKAFLRAPLNFAYISSNFNPKRFHPILKRIKAHNGIDYRAPTGTPVYAAGDGKVTRSDYSKYNGHHVFIQHSGSIETRYLHFTKRTVSTGQRVRQGAGDRIRRRHRLSTAPHLHYEFLVNGVHRNPRTVALPEAPALDGPLLDGFLAACRAVPEPTQPPGVRIPVRQRGMSSQLYIGMISGTSRDGVDVALLDFEDQRPDLMMARCVPYPPALRSEIDSLINAGRRPEPGSTRNLDRQLGHFFARIANDLVADAGLEAHDVRAIGSHGQTVWHDPDAPQPVSLQLGNGFVIANVTRIPAVTDFRSADLAAGGQGAPLAPLLHRELFASDDERRAVLNLGGISNLTLLYPGQPVRGFDCGPANCLMDLWVQRHQGADYDDSGSWAAGGELLGPLLGRLLDEHYFQQPPPKSTGLELFNAAWLEARLGPKTARPRDVQRTLAELCAQTVSDALHLAGGADRLLVCGGGVHNRFLMARLSELLADTLVEPSQALGVHPDWVEASLFAWLARERIDQRPIDTGSITGAREPVLLGEISQP